MKFCLKRSSRYLVFICISLSCFGHSGVARETYAAYATRLLAQAQSENSVRADLERQLWRMANAYRAGKGLRSLANETFSQPAARAHAMDLMQHQMMGHVASTGHDFEERMRALRPGIMILPQMAENAARVSRPGDVNSAMASSLFQQWVKSAAHRHTLLSRDYVSVATGVVSKGGVLYADMIFIGPQVQTNVGGVGVIEGQGVY